MELFPLPGPSPPVADTERARRNAPKLRSNAEWHVANALWPIAWPGMVFWFFNEALEAFASLSTVALSSGSDPGYWLWSAVEHTSRTALALTLLLWAMIRPASGPTSGSAQTD